MPFLGYSGVPAREAVNGFTVAGPIYGNLENQHAYAEQARSAGLPVVWRVGLEMDFHAVAPKKPLDLEPDEIRTAVLQQVRAALVHENICWWYVTPEELRPWREKEIAYLRTVATAIRETDPRKRPVWMYDPNHRETEALVSTGRHLDWIGKGSYCNLAGFRDQRIWVGWSMEQQTRAIERLKAEDARKRNPLMLAELCQDPADPADDHLIPTWVRHDVYLALMNGGKGVAVWSLHRRREVDRTYDLWYDAYARMARELTISSGPGPVLLLGEPVPPSPFDILEGPKEVDLRFGTRNQLEAATTAQTENAEKTLRYSAITVREFDHRGKRWTFLCNSSAATIKFQARNPLPEGAVAVDAFTGQAHGTQGGKLYGWLPALDVRILVRNLP